MTTYGYARVSRGQVDGTEILQNQRVRLTGTGVDAANIHQAGLYAKVRRNIKTG